MWAVPQPSDVAADTFLTCNSKLRDRDLKSRLYGVIPHISSTENEYLSNAGAQTLHLVQRTNAVGSVTKKEMEQVYDDRMVKSAGRPIYDRIKMLPKNDRCPYCNHRNVGTLDHFLPKTAYSLLTVTPINLVGACMECNKAKGDVVPNAPGKVFLHPYFDQITDDEWLFATIASHQTPCAFVFEIRRPASWDDLTHNRVINQFERLKLGALYASEAANELSEIRLGLKMHFDSGGDRAVYSELQRQFRSRRANQINSWRTAFYRAGYLDSWFCNGGFSF